MTSENARDNHLMITFAELEAALCLRQQRAEKALGPNLELKHSPHGYRKGLYPNDWRKDIRFLEGSKS